MVFCKRCDGDVEAQVIEPSGIVVCTGCGHVLDQHSWSQEPTFTKEGGESTVAGHFVSNNAGSHGMGRIANGRIYGMQLDASEKAGGRAKTEIERIVDLLQIYPREDVVNSAQRLFMLAMSHNFTKGRRTAQIAAATIYIICRQENHPFMLLDFADVLQVNVFTLGSVFLQLCRIFRLEEHAIVTKPVDPSLYIHRFADRLKFGSEMRSVADTALRLMRSMKQNWLQTGRRPAGLCGAALYIAGHMHGFSLSKQDVIRVVHVGETTLSKRVSEFTNTGEASLTAIEFKDHIRKDEDEETRQIEALDSLAGLSAPDGGPVSHGCQHIREEAAPMFSDGMCKDCYVEYVRVVGGHDGKGMNPPAYISVEGTEGTLAIEHEPPLLLPEYAGQGGDDYEGSYEEGSEEEEEGSDEELENEMEAALHEGALTSVAKAYVPAKALEKTMQKPKRRKAAESGTRKKARSKRKRDDSGEVQPSACYTDNGIGDAPGSRSSDMRSRDQDVTASLRSKELEVVNRQLVPVASPQKEFQTDDCTRPSEILSDLEDDELDNYLNTPAESKLKDIVWTAMNQDYIEKQALKAALQPVPKADDSAAPEKGGKKSRGRPKGSKSKVKPEDTAPARSAAEGVRKMLDAKKLSSKINYANLDSLFEGDAPEPPQRATLKPPATRPRSKAKPAATAEDVAPAKQKKPCAAPVSSVDTTQPAASKKEKGKKEKPPLNHSRFPESSKVVPETAGNPNGQIQASKLRSSALGSLKGSLSSLQRRSTLAPL